MAFKQYTINYKIKNALSPRIENSEGMCTRVVPAGDALGCAAQMPSTSVNNMNAFWNVNEKTAWATSRSFIFHPRAKRKAPRVSSPPVRGCDAERGREDTS